jgi:hypothetical protein
MQSPGYWRQVRASASGIALANVNARKLAAIRLPLPPRAEQERIATAIEEELSGIEGGLVSLGKVHQRIRAAKVATLAQAYEEARTAGSVSALRDVIGAGALFRDGDWVETKDQDPSGDCRLTQLADIGEGSWRNRSRRYMRRDQFERLGCEPLKANDVLIARMPDPLGRACLFPGDPMACTTAVDVAIIRVGENGPIPRWLMWMINAPQARRQINALRLGTTRQRISRKNLGSILVPSIARPLQEVQAQAIDTAMLALDRTTEAVENTRRGAGALRASLLAAAFRGELIPQHKGEEPASPIVAEAARRRVPPPAYLKARRRNAVPTKRSSHE